MNLTEFRKLDESLNNTYPFVIDDTKLPFYIYRQYIFEVGSTVFAVRFARTNYYFGINSKRVSYMIVGKKVGKKVATKIPSVGNIKKFLATVLAIGQDFSETSKVAEKGLLLRMDNKFYNKAIDLVKMIARIKLKQTFKYEEEFNWSPHENSKVFYIWKKQYSFKSLYSKFMEAYEAETAGEEGEEEKGGFYEEEEDTELSTTPPSAKTNVIDDTPTSIDNTGIDASDLTTTPTVDDDVTKKDDEPNPTNDVYIEEEIKKGIDLIPNENEVLFVGNKTIRVQETGSDSYLLMIYEDQVGIIGYRVASLRSTGHKLYTLVDGSSYTKEQMDINSVFVGVKPETFKSEGMVYLSKKDPDNFFLSIKMGDDVGLIKIKSGDFSIVREHMTLKSLKHMLPIMLFPVKKSEGSYKINDNSDLLTYNKITSESGKTLVGYITIPKQEKDSFLRSVAKKYHGINKASVDKAVDSIQKSIVKKPKVDNLMPKAPTLDELGNRFVSPSTKIEKDIGEFELELGPVSFKFTDNIAKTAEKLKQLKKIMVDDHDMMNKIHDGMGDFLTERRSISFNVYDQIGEDIHYKFPLNDIEHRAISRYTGSNYSGLNKYLRGMGKYSDLDQDQIEDLKGLESAFKNKSVYYKDSNLVLYRGQSIGMKEVEDIIENNSYRTNSYYSTSMNLKTAFSFLRYGETLMDKQGAYSGNEDRTANVMSIRKMHRIPVIIPGRIVSSHPTEAEVILPRETDMRLNNYHAVESSRGNPFYIMDFDIVGVGGKSSIGEARKTLMEMLDDKEEGEELAKEVLIMDTFMDILGVGTMFEEYTDNDELLDSVVKWTT